MLEVIATQPAIGAMPAVDLTSGYVLDILKPIWAKRETARRVKRRISTAMRFSHKIGRTARIKRNLVW